MTHSNGIGLAVGNFDAESLAAKVRISSDMGYGAIEVHGRFVADTPPDDLAEVERLLDKLDMALTVHTGFSTAHGMAAPLEAVVQVGHVVGWHARTGRVACISYDIPWVEIAPGKYRTDPATIAVHFGGILDLTAESGIPVALEDYPLDEESLAPYRDWADRYPHWGILVDLGHMNMLLREPKHDPQPLGPDAVESYIRRIPLAIAETHVHSNDGSEDQHLPPYMGNTDFEAALKALDEVGFDGIHAIEIVPGPDGLHREEILPAARKSILYWRDFLNRT